MHALGNGAGKFFGICCVRQPSKNRGATAEFLGKGGGKRQLEPQMPKCFPLGKNLGRRAVKGDAPAVEHYHAVRGEGIFHVVRDVNDGDALPAQVFDDAADVLLAGVIKKRTRLVE